MGSFREAHLDREVEVVAPAREGSYVLELYLTKDGCEAGDEKGGSLRIAVTVKHDSPDRSHLLHGVEPLSYAWGVDRGLPAHRFHLEQFLIEHAADIRGRCLEFQDPLYARRLGGLAVESLDILHVDDSNLNATIVGDITKSGALPEGRFDCIICTHVLHVIFELHRAVAGLHRMLAPGGVLLVAVPHISMCDQRYGELWRFTPAGLRRLLETSFESKAITVFSYGNSLTAAGEIRGMVAAEFSAEELAAHDPRFAVEVCGRAVKR
jgi:hypothetical protein